MKGGDPQFRSAIARWPRVANDLRDGRDAGFSLVELLIVIVILPIVVGAISLALVSIFSTQGSTAARIGDSGDAQVISANFVTDVHVATMITTDSSSSPQCLPADPLPVGATQVLGLQTNGGQTVVSYEEVPEGSTNTLFRYECQVSTNPVLVKSTALASDVSSGESACVTTSAAPSCPTTVGASSWIPATGVTGVTLDSVGQASSFTYTLAAVPRLSGNPGQASAGAASTNSSCGFAAPGTGTYAPPGRNGSELCFLDFSRWNSQTSAPGLQCTGGAVGMSASIVNTPYTMTFCLAVASQSSDGQPLVGTTTAVDGGITVVGFDGITAAPLPTYYDPPNSQAFLGNSVGGTSFYTGVPGSPALYTVVEGSTSTVTISNIKVLDAAGNPATDWELVTGDAESTDPGESITWSTGTGGPNLNLIPNDLSPMSDVGNACGSTAPSYNTKDLTGVGSSTVECAAPSNQQGEKTGTVMLEALTPSALTATLVGTGRQAMFLGLLLP